MKLKRTMAALMVVAGVLTGCSNLTQKVPTPETSANSTAAPSTTVAATTTPATTAAKKTIPAGTKLGDIDFTGMTKEDALKKASELNDKLNSKVITLSAGGKEIQVKYTELNVKYDFAAAIEKLFKGEAVTDATPKYDDVKLEQLIRTYADDVNRMTENETAAQIVDLDALNAEFIKNINLDPANVTVKGNMIADASKATTAAPDEGDPNSDYRTIGYASTNYSSSSYNRAFNVQLSSSYINDVTIYPGEVFSFNAHVGDTSYSKGYLDGVAYSGGEMVVEPGGGVCQVSTTLYQAVLDAGLKVVERYNHGSVVHYADYGMDATVYYPSVDFKFRNNFSYPITIKAYSEGRDLVVALKGTPPTLSPYTYTYDYEVVGRKEAGYIEKVDPKLSAGEVEIDYYPLNGVTADIYKYTYKNGSLISTDYMYTDTYRPMVGVKLVGSKTGASTKPAATTTPATKPATTPVTTPAATTTPKTTTPATTTPKTTPATTTPATTTPATTTPATTTPATTTPATTSPATTSPATTAPASTTGSTTTGSSSAGTTTTNSTGTKAP